MNIHDKLIPNIKDLIELEEKQKHYQDMLNDIAVRYPEVLEEEVVEEEPEQFFSDEQIEEMIASPTGIQRLMEMKVWTSDAIPALAQYVAARQTGVEEDDLRYFRDKMALAIDRAIGAVLREDYLIQESRHRLGLDDE